MFEHIISHEDFKEKFISNLSVVIISQYIHPVIMLYILNLHHVICQFYLNKAGVGTNLFFSNTPVGET